MKREIKFRGRRRDNGEWVVGSLFNSIWIKSADGSRVCYIFPDNMLDDNGGGDCWEDFAEVAEQYEVDPATVGQFTGLTDMNGREIYEGDRVTWMRHRMDGTGFLEEGHVRFSVDEQRVFVVNRFTTMDDREMLHDIIRCRKHNLCVVGNIHDNPEAIE